AFKKPGGPLEFMRVAQPCVAAVKCGHTRLRLPQTVADFVNKQLMQFPFEVRVYGDKVLIFRDAAFEGKYSGAQIVSINGTPMSKILASMMGSTNADGNSPTGRNRRVEQGFQGSLYIYSAIDPPYRIRLAGVKQEIETPGLTLEQLNAAVARYPE